MLLRIFLSTILFAYALGTSLPLHARPALPITFTNVAEVTQQKDLKSREQREFRLIRFPASEPNAPYRFLIQGGLHGNEGLTTEFILWLAQRYARGQSVLNQLPRTLVSLDLLPQANPDGAAQQNRYNASGINLNRNFGVLWGLSKENPGSHSFSEPETQAIRALMARERYTAAIDVHGYINWVVAPSSPKTILAKTSAQATLYHRWMAAIRATMPQLFVGDYQLKTAGELGDGGAFEDWAFWDQGTLALCLEMQGPARFTVGAGKAATDTFVMYESFIHSMLVQSMRLMRASTGEIASTH